MKTRMIHRCSECGGESPRWLGRCPTCDAWSTLVEEVDASVRSPAGRSGPSLRTAPDGPVPIGEVDARAAAPVPTGVAELDRVLGGGLVPGSVTLLGGEPGIGKSTLLLQALGRMAAAGTRCLLVSAEESVRAGAAARRAARRARRRPARRRRDVAAARARARRRRRARRARGRLDPDGGRSRRFPARPGSVAQVRECAHRLVQLAKERALATVLVGHVTKDGALAGPRVLEHVVDTVLSFEGDRHHALRTAARAEAPLRRDRRARACSRWPSAGLAGVPDPSRAVPRRPARRACRVRWSRPCSRARGRCWSRCRRSSCTPARPMPRRSARGLDGGRLAHAARGARAARAA